MQFCISFSVVCVFCCLVDFSRSMLLGTDLGKAGLYLQKCGYLKDKLDIESSKNALKNFQRFAGSNQTGKVDYATIAMMRKSPCAVKYSVGHYDSEKVQIDIFEDGTYDFDRYRYNARVRKNYTIMTPDNERQKLLFEIHINDVKANQDLYEVEKEPTFPREKEPPGPVANDAPNICIDGSIDTATRTQNGNSYLFKGDFYWRVLETKVADGYPRKIADDWDGLEGNLDASFTWSNGYTFIFKGIWYWKFKNRKMEPGYPKLISQGFGGIPDNLDAAFVSGNDGKTYFFKGEKYWLYDSYSSPPVRRKYPLPISYWIGLPDNIDAAFQFENSMTYFFKGDKYYRIHDNAFQVDIVEPPYPISTSVSWFHCQSNPYHKKKLFQSFRQLGNLNQQD